MAEPLQYTKFNDFRPGIINRSGHSVLAVPAPLGAAQETNTYRCFALATGGLAPLPRRIEQYTLPDYNGSAIASGYWVTGFLVTGPMSSGIGGDTKYVDQAFIGTAYKINAGNQRYRLARMRLYSDNGFDTIRSIDSAYNGRDFYESTWLANTRINRATPTAPGNPVVAHAWATPGGTNEQTIDVWPDPLTPNLNATLNVFNNRWGQLYGHQGRLVLNESIVYSMGTTGGSFTEEQISFTDPPNSIDGTFGSQDEVFVQENPSGYGAFGSISAGELFLVKRLGGGVVVSGDLAFPTVTRLPGVVSTGACVSNRAASTPVGLIYGVKNGGLWVWRGSDTSESLSPQLEDNAFLHPNQMPRHDLTSYMTQQVVSIAEWGNWIVATNNWLFDINTNAWFRLDDSSVSANVNCMYFSKDWSGQFMFGCLPQYTRSTLTAIYVWDRNLGTTTYSWQSQPLHVTQERLVSVREIVLLSEGIGTVEVTLTKLDGSTQVETFNCTFSDSPQLQRKDTYAEGYTCILRIVSTGQGGGAAPVVHDISLGWRESVEASAI